MLQKARVAAFTVSELLRESQHGPPSARLVLIRVNLDYFSLTLFMCKNVFPYYGPFSMFWNIFFYPIHALESVTLYQPLRCLEPSL